MSSMKYALAMVAAGGVAGLASQASATTVNLNIQATDPIESILLAGSTPQYSYGFNGSDKTQLSGSFLSSPSAKMSGPFYTPGLPSESESVTNFAYNTVKTGSLQQNPTDFYLHLKFDDDLGNHYRGVANFDGAATLKSIDFTGGVPEPDSWALLIGGIGLAGAAVRRKRRVEAQAATA